MSGVPPRASVERLAQFRPKYPGTHVHIPVLWSQTPRLEQSIWHKFPADPVPFPPGASTPSQSVSLTTVSGSSPEGHRRKEQSAPKYSPTWVSPLFRPTFNKG